MRCLFCTYNGAFTGCVGICRQCGAAVCYSHSTYRLKDGVAAVLCPNCWDLPIPELDPVEVSRSLLLPRSVAAITRLNARLRRPRPNRSRRND